MWTFETDLFVKGREVSCVVDVEMGGALLLIFGGDAVGETYLYNACSDHVELSEGVVERWWC